MSGRSVACWMAGLALAAGTAAFAQPRSQVGAAQPQPAPTLTPTKCSPQIVARMLASRHAPDVIGCRLAPLRPIFQRHKILLRPGYVGSARPRDMILRQAPVRAAALEPGQTLMLTLSNGIQPAPAVTPTPTPRPTPTRTPRPMPTPTASPTPTPTASPTPRPTPTPTRTARPTPTPSFSPIPTPTESEAVATPLPADTPTPYPSPSASLPPPPPDPDNSWLWLGLGGVLLGLGLLGFTAVKLRTPPEPEPEPAEAMPAVVPVTGCRVEPGSALPSGDGEPDPSAPPFRIATRIDPDPPVAGEATEQDDG